jgi:hypothetical protein
MIKFDISVIVPKNPYFETNRQMFQTKFRKILYFCQQKFRFSFDTISPNSILSIKAIENNTSNEIGQILIS